MRGVLSVALAAGVGCAGPPATGPSPGPSPSASPTPASILTCPVPGGPPLPAGTTVAYVAERATAGAGGVVAAYAVDPTRGCLAPLGRATVPGLWSLTVDPTGQFLYVGASGSREVLAYRIDPATGLFDPIERYPAPFTAAHAPGTMVASARSLFAIMRAMVTGYRNLTWSYLIDPRTGVLTSLGEVTRLVDTTFLEMHPTGQVLYVVAYESASGSLRPLIQTLRVDRSGSVLEVGRTPVGLSSASLGLLGRSAAMDPTGRFLWLTLREEGGAILCYRIDSSDGLPELAAIERTPPDGLGTSLGEAQLAADPGGRFLFAASSTRIRSYIVRRNTTGALEASGEVTTTGSAGAVAVSPSGAFLYASGTSSDVVRAYAINGDDGTLREIGSVAPGGSALALVRIP